MMEPVRRSDTTEAFQPPTVIISGDIPSFPVNYRLKKPLSRLSLATDRLSCVSFLTSSQRSDVCACLPRWRSLPNDLQSLDFLYHSGDGDYFLKNWSRYRGGSKISRRYKTMDFINAMPDECSGLEVFNGGLSTIVGLSVSRDVLDCRIDASDAGSGIVPCGNSDEHLDWPCDADTKHLTETNLNLVFSSSRTCSYEQLSAIDRNAHKIERWLQRCHFQPRSEDQEVENDNS